MSRSSRLYTQRNRKKFISQAFPAQLLPIEGALSQKGPGGVILQLHRLADPVRWASKRRGGKVVPWWELSAKH